MEKKCCHIDKHSVGSIQLPWRGQSSTRASAVATTNEVTLVVGIFPAHSASPMIGHTPSLLNPLWPGCHAPGSGGLCNYGLLEERLATFKETRGGVFFPLATATVPVGLQNFTTQ